MEVTAESPTRLSSASSSPEFEFWMLRNPPPSQNPQPPLLSADELFADGVLLPLHILSLAPTADSDPPLPPSLPPAQAPLYEDPSPPPPPFKKWKDIFKPGEKKLSADKKDRKPFHAVATPEINIHIWPFSRSRSSGNNRPRAQSSSAGRKISSAPCSRCNSSGDSSKQGTGGGATGMPTAAAVASVRNWAPTPSRAGGIYLGRSNPVLQLKRRKVASGKKNTGGAKECRPTPNPSIGRQIPATCRECEKDAKSDLDDRSSGASSLGHGAEDAGGEVTRSLFNLRAIFTRKVY